MLFIDPETLQEENEGGSSAKGTASAPNQKSRSSQSQSTHTLRVLLRVAKIGIAAIVLMLATGILSVALGWGAVSVFFAIAILWTPLILGASIWILGAIWLAQRTKDQRKRS